MLGNKRRAGLGGLLGALMISDTARLFALTVPIGRRGEQIGKRRIVAIVKLRSRVRDAQAVQQRHHILIRQRTRTRGRPGRPGQLRRLAGVLWRLARAAGSGRPRPADWLAHPATSSPPGPTARGFYRKY
jgi:hypothetical protein